MKRRAFLSSLGGCAALAVPGLCLGAEGSAGHVVVIGGGYGGATAARYLRVWSGGRIRVTLVEPNPDFVSCPMSNLVLEGALSIGDVTVSYEDLQRRHGVKWVRDTVERIDAGGRRVVLKSGVGIAYDRLIVSPGIDFMWEKIPGMASPGAHERILHAWKAGPQTVALRRQLEAMPDGGRFIIAIPEAPYRCPPAPYERACLVASYFKKHKPRAKVHVFDANADVTSKGALFKAAWKKFYPGMIEYTPEFRAVDVDAAKKKVIFEFGEEESADVLNLLPPMRAGGIAVKSGLATANGRWCEVDFLTFESRVAAGVHVLGDSIQIAPVMPKAGHMANQHGKTCAAALVALLTQQEVNPLPIYANTCYSFVTASQAMHVSTVHRYDAGQKTMLTVPGAGGLSVEPSEGEGRDAMSWARAIWSDMLS
ncbi:NAD(P)/FAD-dependent oxidoreductase [Paralcaligenes ureilyticus]|uniref:NADPH-dependent 2,4-dienoyl-CoA reductase/sulfur reductase-like enzyme n=1 Tax=Paralcaligenes ureilyticus TaxID=627131 RepID=A0A4R3MBX3_9BURK|nr:NAD(P)/FAD-dependent oxidoreductase [Paralcaligenes ureilyticus]TCT10866.1 NADPH-dependent 2,4-dienoyl-CoA reductase/sulfur reductase-like enzyme [Paralcaligenes ureilyticus]